MLYERQTRVDFTEKFMGAGSSGRTEQYPRLADLANLGEQPGHTVRIADITSVGDNLSLAIGPVSLDRLDTAGGGAANERDALAARGAQLEADCARLRGECAAARGGKEV